MHEEALNRVDQVTLSALALGYGKPLRQPLLMISKQVLLKQISGYLKAQYSMGTALTPLKVAGGCSQTHHFHVMNNKYFNGFFFSIIFKFSLQFFSSI